MGEADDRFRDADRFRETELTVAGLVQRVNDHENDYRVFAPMVVDQALMRKSLEDLAKSLDGAHDAIRKLDEKLDHEREERIKGQADRKRELEEAQATRDVEIKRIEADRMRRDDEISARADEQRASNRRLLYGLVGIFITSASAVLVQVLTGVGAG